MTDDPFLPDLTALSSLLLSDIEKARRETRTDWSDVPLWKILATTSENPYGIRSKQGLRRLERQARKRLLHHRPKGKNLDGSWRKDYIKSKEREKWEKSRGPRRKERLRTDPLYKFETMKRMARNRGIEWTLPFEKFLEMWEPGREDWSLRRIDTSRGWEDGNVEVNDKVR